jgi:acetyl-CoA acyltransferase 1
MAIRNIAHSIRAGEISLGVAVGVESMSLKSVWVIYQLCVVVVVVISLGSYLLVTVARSPRPTPVVVDAISANPQAHDCIQVRPWALSYLYSILVNSYVLAAHGVDLRNGSPSVQYLTAEAGRIRAHFPHASSKGYASLSLLFSNAENKAECVVQALVDGVFAEEILPIELRGAVVSVDDTVRPNVSAEGLAALKPSFPEWGNALTTAGNASGVGDGAALCILTTRARAEAEGFDILAKFVGTAIVGVEPRYMGIAPIYAIPKVLEQTGLDQRDIDIYEVRTLPCYLQTPSKSRHATDQ